MILHPYPASGHCAWLQDITGYYSETSISGYVISVCLDEWMGFSVTKLQFDKCIAFRATDHIHLYNYSCLDCIHTFFNMYICLYAYIWVCLLPGRRCHVMPPGCDTRMYQSNRTCLGRAGLPGQDPMQLLMAGGGGGIGPTVQAFSLLALATSLVATSTGRPHCYTVHTLQIAHDLSHRSHTLNPNTLYVLCMSGAM